MDSPFALPSLSSTVSHEDLCLFHRIDRLLYRFLVINLHRDPIESIQVLAMWLWLERMGCRHLVKKITSLPYMLINAISDETVSCLKYIKTYTFSYFSYMSYPSETCHISLLKNVSGKEISAQLLYDNRDSALKGVAEIMHNVCAKAFDDIMKQAIIRNFTERMEAHTWIAEQQQQQQQQQQFWFGLTNPSDLQNDSNLVRSGADHYQFSLENNHGEVVPADERTLFLTFSKGFPVEEWEVKEFFTMLFGDDVEGLYMQEVQPGEQALFARVVFRSPSIIDMIVEGSSKAKFNIRGKHVWARKFVPKHTRNVLQMPTHNYNYYNGESSGTTGMM